MSTTLEERTEEFYDRIMHNKNATDDAMAALVEEGIDYNFQSNLNGNTPLSMAASKGLIKTCRTMIKHGENIHRRTLFLQSTALHAAARARQKDTCLALLELGADPNMRNKREESALFDASPTMRDLLIAHGADKHACDEKGQSLLHAEAESDTDDDYKPLLNYGIDINDRTHTGQTVMDTVLHYYEEPSFCCLNRELIKPLIDQGANLYARTEGLSSFDQAALFFDKDNLNRTISSYGVEANDIPHWLESCKKSYTDFLRTAKPPNTTTDLCYLLAATPLANPDGAVDQQAHLRQIFSHAKWGPGQAAKMAEALHKKHIVTATFAEELAAIGEPHKTRNLAISGRAR